MGKEMMGMRRCSWFSFSFSSSFSFLFFFFFFFEFLRESYLLLLLRFFSVIEGGGFPFFPKIGEDFSLVGWLVAVFFFFGDFGRFFGGFCTIAIFTYEWPASWSLFFVF